MQVSANRAVVIISGLMTLLVLSGGALAVGLHQGWIRIASNDAVAADPQASVALNEREAAMSSEAPAARAAQRATQDETAIYRQKLDEAYLAPDDAYAQIRALQSPQAALAAARHDDDRDAERDDDDDRRGRRFDRRRSHDD
jgi:hypothetical protein